MTAHNRPSYLEQTLASWMKVRGEWDIYMRIEPNGHGSYAVATSYGLEPVVNRVRRGVLSNIWYTADDLFNDGADFVIFAEDDVLVSDDIVEMMEFGAANYRDDPNVLGVCSTQRWVKPTPEQEWTMRLRNHFAAPSWGTWADRWYDLLRDDWDHDYTHNGWDWQVGRMVLDDGYRFAVPDFCRCQHIGMVGTHMNAATFQSALCPSWQEHHEPGEWTMEVGV